MRLAISNIAWEVDEDEAIVALLQRYAIDAIDIAPGKYFPEPARATDQDIARVRAWWGERGIELTGMQALLFGTTGLNLFAEQSVQQAMLAHLGAVCRIAGGLGATRLVFGSPKNRDRSGLDDRQVKEKSTRFFRQLGDIAQSHGVMICLEPNPACYGANFMTGSLETLAVVEQIEHPAVRMQLDTGAITLNEENAAEVVECCAPYIGHVHASEPNLVPLGDGGCDHAGAAHALTERLPSHLVTIEMVATRNEPHVVSIERALQVAVSYYRQDGRAST
ncbi:sugar phosphate isomerase/epimerase [Stutzerimonas nosocomialis]|uniref:sugar phosphate isomerase/epimerase family protein n=1 Tax=Stutzerimonas nosocomialis TaxID=1056496 RepID=UPI0011099DEA|nr:sugar phosphate isomerase/epimerase [Stutzerimonas nosocomialis]TLX58048.1 sugar phosphate isomerase/epimerase [Stutzerimonas nosocomialis]